MIPHSASPYHCHNANYAIPSPDEISRITKSLEYLISGNYHHQSPTFKNKNNKDM